ncbi:MAG: flavodoxin family protein [Spirochaetia bacterium]
MTIGIIVYSETGNTLKAAEQLLARLQEDGHTAAIERVTTDAEEGTTAGKNYTLVNMPDVTKYQAVVFAAPVQAFSLNPVMKTYMEKLPSLEGKGVACFVTKHLPGRWTGGTQAVKWMKKICRARKGSVQAEGIIVVSNEKKDQMIEETISSISKVFQNE